MIAWLGTGLLGSGFVKAALKRGESVRVWNRTIAKAKALESLGAIVAATPTEAARGADRIHLCLSDDASVDAVIDELLADASFKTTIIDHTTVTPHGATARAKRLAARGIGFIAAPVFMGPAMAAEATGRMLCAGKSDVVTQFAPALKAMTGELVQLGEDVVTPCTLKLIGNALIIGVSGVVADTFAIGQGAGISAKDVFTFISAMPLGAIVNQRGARMSQGDYAASFELSMARKDVRLMQETAAERPLASLDGLGARMDRLIDQGHGAKDLAALSIDTIPAK